MQTFDVYEDIAKRTGDFHPNTFSLGKLHQRNDRSKEKAHNRGSDRDEKRQLQSLKKCGQVLFIGKALRKITKKFHSVSILFICPNINRNCIGMQFLFPLFLQTILFKSHVLFNEVFDSF